MNLHISDVGDCNWNYGIEEFHSGSPQLAKIKYGLHKRLYKFYLTTNILSILSKTMYSSVVTLSDAQKPCN